MEGAHRQVVGAAVVGGKLFLKVGQGVESVAGVKAFLVPPVAALHLSVVPGCVGPDQLVPDAQFFGGPLEEGGEIPPAVGETVGELKAVVRLDALHPDSPAGKPLHRAPQKVRRGIGGLLRVGPQEAQPSELVHGAVLK